MFYYLNGTVALLEENTAVIDCGGVGYRVFTSTYSQAQMKTGQPCQVFTCCVIREDAFDIYGFATKEELNWFRLLRNVNGVGPRVALSILSSITPKNLSLAILSEDDTTICSAPGVGKKLAQRIILDCKDKLGTSEIDFSGDAGAAANVRTPGSAAGEASAALASLGYSASEIAQAMRGVDAALSAEEMIRSALRNMVTR